MKERLDEHEPEMEEPSSMEEKFSDFLVLKVSLETNNFQAFVYKILTNQTETSRGVLTEKNTKYTEIDPINKKRRCNIYTFHGRYS